MEKRYAYKIPRKYFATIDGIKEYTGKGKLTHTLYIGANSEEQALKRIRKTNDNFIFVGEVDVNDIPLPKPIEIKPVEVINND